MDFLDIFNDEAAQPAQLTPVATPPPPPAPANASAPVRAIRNAIITARARESKARQCASRVANQQAMVFAKLCSGLQQRRWKRRVSVSLNKSRARAGHLVIKEREAKRRGGQRRAAFTPSQMLQLSADPEPRGASLARSWECGPKYARSIIAMVAHADVALAGGATWLLSDAG